MASAPAGEKAPAPPPGWDFSRPWYHGSPLRLHVLLAGSTITQDIVLARAFSHKPRLVSIDDETTPMRIRHNGTLPGLLYTIAEPVSAADVYPHPNSTMPPGLEWLTRRPLHLALVGAVDIEPGELLSQEEIDWLLSHGKPPKS